MIKYRFCTISNFQKLFVMESIGNESEEALAARITIRVIRSFPHRNIRNILVKEVPLSLTTEQLLERVTTEISNSSLPPPFRWNSLL